MRQFADPGELGEEGKVSATCTFKDSNGVKVQITCGDDNCPHRQPEYRKKSPNPKK